MNIKSMALVLGKAVNESAAVMDKQADLINVTMAKLIKHRMNSRPPTFIAVLSCLATVIALEPAYSLTYTIGNNFSAGSVSTTALYGQSFTPSVGGNAADTNFGIVASQNPSTVYLNSFTFNDPSYNTLPATIGIYDSSGSLITSSISKSNSTYNFDGSTSLNYTQKYSAFSTTRIASAGYFVGTGYPGGGRLISNSTPPGSESSFDLRFSATFSDSSATQAVPWNVEPGQGVALGLPLFIGLRMLKKRRALKNSTRKVHDLTSAR